MERIWIYAKRLVQKKKKKIKEKSKTEKKKNFKGKNQLGIVHEGFLSLRFSAYMRL